MTVSASLLWKSIVEQVSRNSDRETAITWLQPVRPKAIEGESLLIEVPNKLFSDWIRQHYVEAIERSASALLERPVRVKIDVRPSAAQDETGEARPRFTSTVTRRKLFGADIRLNPKYSFDTFVVGPNNRFAHAASIAVAQSPAKAYNPLFIYGGVGLGKTHLMQAIGHSILARSGDSNVIYISSEKFTNQLIDAIQNRTTIKFRNKYRNVDILLIDDIHFLGGKEQTQEEFFHTFNTLYDAHKQIVLSSDRPPKEIPNLEDRLVSRFEWGLVTDLQPPDMETRVAILRKKAEGESVSLSDDILFYIASQIKSNVRKLEGALSRLTAYTSLMKAPMNIQVAEAILSDLTGSEGAKTVTIEAIQKKVAEYYDIRVSDMMSKKRPQAIAFPRQIAMFLARQLTGSSLPEIGEAFGGRDHTTALHATKAIEARLKGDEGLRKIVAYLQRQLKD
ncbi:MAG: chromosomal replication initiator protein DnaA [bacterium]|nr:chromosomal replication initiator protein DnaA [bacterium]